MSLDLDSCYKIKKSDAALMIDFKDTERISIIVEANDYWASIYLNEYEALKLCDYLK